MKTNIIHYRNSQNMKEVPERSVDLIVTSPPYFNIKNYNVDDKRKKNQIGDINIYQDYIQTMVPVWLECERILKPNGKLAINTMMMPMPKKEYSTHYNRDILDLDGDIKHSILNQTKLYLYDRYIWNRLNSSKNLMFGSYPNPPNFYSQNSSEYISIYVKDGKPENKRTKEIKDKSALTQKEWVSYTKHIWDIPIPLKSDIAYGKHPAIMPLEIAYRCIRLFSFYGDIVLDPFTGSGTTLCAAKKAGRQYIGYEIIKDYKEVINKKLAAIKHDE